MAEKFPQLNVDYTTPDQEPGFMDKLYYGISHLPENIGISLGLIPQESYSKTPDRYSVNNDKYEAAKTGPTVKFVDTTPFATERNNRSTDASEYVIQDVATLAKYYNIDPYLALGIATVETNLGNPVEGKFRDVSNPMKENGWHNEQQVLMLRQNADPHLRIANDTVNHTADAMSHLSQLRDRYDGDMDKAIRGYNGFGIAKLPTGQIANKDYVTKVKEFAKSLKANPRINEIVNSSNQR
jgi:hypothetical protein